MKSFPRARWIALASIVAISFASGAWLTRARPSAEGNVYQQARLFENVVGSIHRHYIDSMGEGDLYQRAANALVTSLNDPYAELLVRESYREYQRQMTGTQLRSGVKGPAESGWGFGGVVGLNPGDEILAVDGKSTKGWDAGKVDEAIRDGGAAVTVLVRPIGSDRPVVRKITRTAVHVPAASPGVLLDGGRGLRSAAPHERERRGRASGCRGPPAWRGHEGPGAGSTVQSWRPDPGGREGRRALPPDWRHGCHQQGKVAPRVRGRIWPRTRLGGPTSGWCCW